MRSFSTVNGVATGATALSDRTVLVFAYRERFGHRGDYSAVSSIDFFVVTFHACVDRRVPQQFGPAAAVGGVASDAGFPFEYSRVFVRRLRRQIHSFLVTLGHAQFSGGQFRLHGIV